MISRDTLPSIVHTTEEIDGYVFTRPHVPSVEVLDVIKGFVAGFVENGQSRTAVRAVQTLGTAAATSYGVRCSARHTVDTFVPLGQPLGLVQLTASQPKNGPLTIINISRVC